MHGLPGGSCFGLFDCAPKNTLNKIFRLIIHHRVNTKNTKIHQQPTAQLPKWWLNPPNHLLHLLQCTSSNIEPKHSPDQSKSPPKPKSVGHIPSQFPKTSPWQDSITSPTKEQTTMFVVIYVKRIWVDGSKRMTL